MVSSDFSSIKGFLKKKKRKKEELNIDHHRRKRVSRRDETVMDKVLYYMLVLFELF